MPAAPDTALRFDSEDVGTLDSLTTAVLVPNADGVATVMAASPLEVVSVSGPPFRAPFPGRAGSGEIPSSNSLLALDWNNDFLTDVAAAGEGGLRLFIQGADGGFIDGTPAGEPVCVCYGAWAADVEMDGDLDIVAAAVEGPALVLRNDGNGGWTSLSPFGDVSNVRGFVWADLDRDGDPDALFLDREGRLRGFANRRAGDFIPLSDLPEVTDAAALSVADMDADGSFDAVLLDRGGRIQRLSLVDGAWQRVDLAAFDGLDADPGTSHLIPADLDNNGALDLVVRGGGASRVWMSDETHTLRAIEAPLPVSVAAAADLDGDGRLDLIGGAAPNRIVRLLNRGTLDYHWKIVRPRAQPTAGDQRINAFGVGGDIEVRSGLLVQKQVLTGGPVHIGLGERTAIDVARIVWPNGVAQAEFGEGVDDVLVAEQRLKGSCPWVFAWDGSRMQFVTDFLWRSPLGLRINAQDTAGVVQTEDWVRIRGDSLAPRDGAYDIRITAELWETHFFDHLALLVVDHPDGSEVYVDERFSAGAPPALKVHAVRDRRAVTEARDHTGADVTPLVSARDGRYLATFEKGRYQGVAEEHFVELEYDGRADVLLASGWIYPTDSSINVAIAQGGQMAPSGLSLEARAGDGRWHVVNGDLGFPAGKNKTVVIDLTAARGATRLRLRTNLEISWDALELAARSDAPLRTTRLAAERAELRYRGFSATTSPRGEAPETPHYDQIATTSQRWRDLVGYHTRFGEVTELVAAVDDRYVIMNAGDEMQVLFPEQPAPAGGWSRDFVLIGDGWEKDGDFNTGFSQTVLPLPSHDRPDYGAGVTSLALEDDPVYQRHKDDWQHYHTRYVTPRRFADGLQVASPRRP